MWKPVEIAGGTPVVGGPGGGRAAGAPAEGRSWKLFLNRDRGVARSTAAAAGDSSDRGATFVPPDAADLPLLLERLGPVPAEARTVFLADLHRAFPCRGPIRRAKGRAETPPVPVVATPAYLLARLTRLGAGERRLLASAGEDEIVRRAPGLLQGRSAACRFEVVRKAVPPSGPAPITGPGAAELEAAADAFGVLRVALHAPDVVVRAKAAAAGAAADPDNAVAHRSASWSGPPRRSRR